MEQLLSIKTIPIEIEINVQRAELKHIKEKIKNLPTINVTRQNNAIQLQANPITIDFNAPLTPEFDIFEHSSLSNSIKLTYEGVARMNGSDSTVNTQNNNHKIKVNRASKSIESVLSSLPRTNHNSVVSFDNGKLSVSYSMDGSENNFNFNESEFEFIPGKIEFVIKQMPDIEIEYLGDPIYFPRSADPNYDPIVDTLA